MVRRLTDEKVVYEAGEMLKVAKEQSMQIMSVPILNEAGDMVHIDEPVLVEREVILERRPVSKAELERENGS